MSASCPPKYRNQVPNLKQLFEELASDATTQRRLQECAHHWRRNYVFEGGQSGKDLTSWRSKPTMDMLYTMARDFLESEKNCDRFWPSKGARARDNGLNGLRYPDDTHKICSLMQQVFWRQNEYEMRNARHPDRHHVLGKSRHRSEDVSSASSIDENREHRDRGGYTVSRDAACSPSPSSTHVSSSRTKEDAHVLALNGRRRRGSLSGSAAVSQDLDDKGNVSRYVRAKESVEGAMDRPSSPSVRQSWSDGETDSLSQAGDVQQPTLAAHASQNVSNTATSPHGDGTLAGGNISRSSQLEEMTTTTTELRRGRPATCEDNPSPVPRGSRRSPRSSSVSPMVSTEQTSQRGYPRDVWEGVRHRRSPITPMATRRAGPAIEPNPISSVSQPPGHSTRAKRPFEPVDHLTTDQGKERPSTRPSIGSRNGPLAATDPSEGHGSLHSQDEKHHDARDRSRKADSTPRGLEVDKHDLDDSFALAAPDSHGVASAKYDAEMAPVPRQGLRPTKDDARPASKKLQIRYTIIKSRTPTLIKQNWKTDGLSGKTFAELCDEVAQIVGQPWVHRVHFELLLKEVRFEYVVDRDEPVEYDELRDIFTEEIKRDMKTNRNMRFEISLEPDPVAEKSHDNTFATKHGHHDMDFTI